MEIYEIQVEGSTAAYQHVTADGEVFYDATGAIVQVTPTAYIYRSWCPNPPAWV